MPDTPQIRGSSAQQKVRLTTKSSLNIRAPIFAMAKNVLAFARNDKVLKFTPTF